MGFFSQDCEGCGHPALCRDATNKTNRWMTQVVVIKRNGGVHAGEYDGYGSVGGYHSEEPVVGLDSTVWHQACWEVAGKPLEYRGASKDSLDQGWFFDEGDHDLPDPRRAK